MQGLKYFAAVLLAVTLAACGGGGGSSGTSAVGGGGTGTGGTGTGSDGSSASATGLVTDFALFTDKNTINNSGTDKAKLTVVAVDASRNIVEGAVVAVAVDQNAVFAPQGGTNTTDATGSYVGELTIGGDKSDRTINLNVMVNGITKSTAVRVAGSRLTVQASPSTPSPGQQGVVTVSLLDSAGNAIPNAVVTLGGNVSTLAGTTLTTGIAGTAQRNFTAPTTAGNYAISATANGVNSGEYQLAVFSSAVPSAVIPAGAQPSLSASPNVLAANSAGSTANRSTLRFLFLDSSNNPIQNVRVRFSDETSGLSKVGASISSGTATLYTDSSGSVSTQYIAGQNSSPTNGVTVRACYSATDFTSPTDCPGLIQASLTIAGQALAVSIGDDNLLEPGSGTYIKRFAVTVADSAGRAVPNAPVDISVDLTHYGKGNYQDSYLLSNSTTVTATAWITLVPSGLTDAYPADKTTSPTASPPQRIWCPNEDTNRNGNVDPGENIDGSRDSNGQPTLEPRKSDLIVSYNDPAVTTTNASGILVIKAEYSQRFATWLAYKVRVTANVSGSQGMAERLFITSFIRGDDENGGSFLQPPYGVRSCSEAN